jgi:hypothetical protein
MDMDMDIYRVMDIDMVIGVRNHAIGLKNKRIFCNSVT